MENQSFKVKVKDKELEVERLPNGKFKIPDISQFVTVALGSTWLDDARIPFQSPDDLEQASTTQGGRKPQPMDWESNSGTIDHPANLEGRFPANLIVSDDVLNDGTTHTSGKDPVRTKVVDSEIFGGGKGLGFKPTGEVETFYGDSGSFSRYFSLDSWWAERVKELPEAVRKTFPFLIEPKAGKGERNEGLDGEETFRATLSGGNMTGGRTDNRTGTKTKNYHPTVKPIAIMSYLIMLGSRQGEIVLDPFMGSGTTGIAAKMLGRAFIGIEIDPESFKIAEARIDNQGHPMDSSWFEEAKS